MTTAGVRWPSKDEYDVTIAHWKETVWDQDIRSGMLAYDNLGICRFGGANLYVCVYKIGDWMIRCFCYNAIHPVPADILQRYRAIDRFCRANTNRVSALVPVTYIEQGIAVGPRFLPIIKIPFLTGCPSLGEFLVDHYREQPTVQRLCDAWLRMIREMEMASMAHGDLDLSNVLVEMRNNELTLRLIDYDNAWIPELQGLKQTEYGHANFQHPSFIPPHERPYNAEMDRFAALVIYISLRTLVDHPELYDQWGADESERLLLAEADYRQAGLANSLLSQLRGLSKPDLYPYIDELNACLREARMPCSLGVISRLAQQSAPGLPPQLQSQAMPVPVQKAPVAMWKQAVYTNASPFPNQVPPATSFRAVDMPAQSPAQPPSYNSNVRSNEREGAQPPLPIWQNGRSPSPPAPSRDVNSQLPQAGPWDGNIPFNPASPPDPWGRLAPANPLFQPPPPIVAGPPSNLAPHTQDLPAPLSEKTWTNPHRLFVAALIALIVLVLAIAGLVIYFVIVRYSGNLTQQSSMAHAHTQLLAFCPLLTLLRCKQSLIPKSSRCQGQGGSNAANE